MSDQVTLDFEAPAQRVDTSVAAARTARSSGKALKDRTRIYALMRTRIEGLTQREACELIPGLSRQSACPRFRELEGYPFKHGVPQRPVLIRKLNHCRENCRIYVAD